MLAKTFFSLLISLTLYSNNTLNKTYHVNTKDINLSHIIPHVKSDLKLFSIEKSKHTKRVKTKDLLKTLKKLGYTDYNSKSSYTNFKLKSPIDTSKIELKLINYYQSKYENINITNIFIEPRGYLASLPNNYTVNIRDRNYLSKSGVLDIKTSNNKKIFFNYNITATLSVYKTRKKMKKDAQLSAINVNKKRVVLDKFVDKPIQNVTKGKYQSKRHISKNKILTIRDVEAFNVVKRGSLINISLRSDNMSINFSAKALQEGKINDIIRVQKSNGKKIKVRIIGKNRAEMQ
ncbi:flagellar basal body P-ring formation protein FlgA [Candidatus Sulfurimonas marisnigri]|uniref:Flagellar basal body P-ring formation protein FlgA n=1 Tax=Candidatus Sulfurimonas marisnigri TaxID=2740405 RepID=A0A7S7LY64_9BACT|nr:flagellar basal body P-ring formation chaperone FlgA [Candidatus Sulfurimonas marisnigri]QOY53627.1 flagellar basal body P-ring formation protein FlgA [Candidatus Sulfurimonas marisnigri]